VSKDSGIVDDGYERAYDAHIKEVRVEVAAKYAEELKDAGFWRRIRLRRQMDGEIREKMEHFAPSDGLY
jgi:hypothetical protein